MPQLCLKFPLNSYATALFSGSDLVPFKQLYSNGLGKEKYADGILTNSIYHESLPY